MKTYLPSVIVGIALTGAAFGFGAVTAQAADVNNQNAGQVSAELTSMGYAVQENGAISGDLSRCAVTGVEGLTSGKAIGTAYFDVSCPSSNN